MANVLNNEKKQQILALGQLGWSLRRIQAATHVRRETISTYLKALERFLDGFIADYEPDVPKANDRRVVVVSGRLRV